jgi:hypothetical protein
MATPYVKNVPDQLYAALRNQARQNRRYVHAEVIALLETFVPTARELRRSANLSFAWRLFVRFHPHLPVHFLRLKR